MTERIHRSFLLSPAAAVLMLAAALLAAGCNSSEQQKPQVDLSKVQLRGDIVVFSYRVVPRIYSGLVKIDDELLLIDEELQRLKKIETDYPRQRGVVIAEKKNWISLRKDLVKALDKLKKEIEKIYVTYLVNKEKGEALIDQKSDAILAVINSSLDETSPYTNRLRPPPVKQSFLDKIKSKFTS
jgi:hypothetical protein